MQALGLGPMPVFAKNPLFPSSLRRPLNPPSTNLLPAFPSLRNTQSLGRTRFFIRASGTASVLLAQFSSNGFSLLLQFEIDLFFFSFFVCYLSVLPSSLPGSTPNPHPNIREVAGGGAYVEEPATKVKFQTSLSFPGCSTPLTLIGAGYREKVFAIIGVKVYAAALYTNHSISNTLSAWRGRSVADVEKDDLLFKSIFEAPLEKSLQIILVRDIDGETFWDALDDAIAPRIKAPTSEDESALSMFRSIFQGKPLKKGTSIFLTWPDPSKMMVSVSSNGSPSDAAATIESANANSALFDVFFGNAPVSPSLKGSVASGLALMLK